MDRLKNLPISNCQEIIRSLEEASLSHKKPSAPSLGMFLAKYRTKYNEETEIARNVLKSDCDFCRNGHSTVVFAGDHPSSMAIISTKDGFCRTLKPRDPSGIYKYYRTERQPCSRCDKGFAVNDGFKYDRETMVRVNENAFQNDMGAAVFFSGGQFRIPYFVKYINNIPERT